MYRYKLPIKSEEAKNLSNKKMQPYVLNNPNLTIFCVHEACTCPNREYSVHSINDNVHSKPGVKYFVQMEEQCIQPKFIEDPRSPNLGLT